MSLGKTGESSARNPLRDDPRIREMLAPPHWPRKELPEQAGARAMLHAMFDSKISGRDGDSVARAAKAEFELLKGHRSLARKLGESGRLDGPPSWPIETWRRALELKRGTPQSLGQLFAVVTTQALRSGDLELAKEMVQGLATLGSGARVLAHGSGEYFLAARSAGRMPRGKSLETWPGLLEATFLGASDVALAVIEHLQKLALALGDERARTRLETSYRQLRQRLNEATESSAAQSIQGLTEQIKRSVDDLGVGRTILELELEKRHHDLTLSTSKESLTAAP